MSTGPEEITREILEELEASPGKRLTYPELRQRFVKDKKYESGALIQAIFALERHFHIYRYEEIEERNCYIALTYPPEKPVGEDLFAELLEEAKRA